MDTYNAIVETLALMSGAAWDLKWWIAALIVVMAVIGYYAPVLDYDTNPAPAQKDDRL